MNKQSLQTLIREQIIEDLFCDLEYDNSTLSNYVDELAVNIILRKMNANQRKRMYHYLLKTKLQKAKSFIYHCIPNFNEIFLISIEKTFNELLD